MSSSFNTTHHHSETVETVVDAIHYILLVYLLVLFFFWSVSAVLWLHRRRHLHHNQPHPLSAPLLSATTPEEDPAPPQPVADTNTSLISVTLACRGQPIGLRLTKTPPLTVQATLPLPDGRPSLLEGVVPRNAVLFKVNNLDATRMTLDEFKSTLQSNQETRFDFKRPATRRTALSEVQARLSHWRTAKRDDNLNIVEVVIPVGVRLGARMTHLPPLRVRQILDDSSRLNGVVGVGSVVHSINGKNASLLSLVDLKTLIRDPTRGPLVLGFNCDPPRVDNDHETQPVSELPQGCCVHLQWEADTDLANPALMCGGVCVIGWWSRNTNRQLPRTLESLLSPSEFNTVRLTIRNVLVAFGVVFSVVGFALSAMMLAYGLWFENSLSFQSGRCDHWNLGCFSWVYVVVVVVPHVVFVVASQVARVAVAWSVSHELGARFRDKRLSFKWKKNYLRIARY